MPAVNLVLILIILNGIAILPGAMLAQQEDSNVVKSHLLVFMLFYNLFFLSMGRTCDLPLTLMIMSHHIRLNLANQLTIDPYVKELWVASSNMVDFWYSESNLERRKYLIEEILRQEP